MVFIFIYFEWRDTENQQFGVLDSWSLKEIRDLKIQDGSEDDGPPEVVFP